MSNNENNENNEKSLKEAAGNIANAAKQFANATRQCGVLCGRKTARTGRRAQRRATAACAACQSGVKSALNTARAYANRTRRFFHHGYRFLAGNDAWHLPEEALRGNEAAAAPAPPPLPPGVYGSLVPRPPILARPPYMPGDMLTMMQMITAMRQWEEAGYQAPASWPPEYAGYLDAWHMMTYGTHIPGMEGAAGGGAAAAAAAGPAAGPAPAPAPVAPYGANGGNGPNEAERERRRIAYARTAELNRLAAERDAAAATAAAQERNAKVAANLQASRDALEAFRPPGGDRSIYEMLGVPRGSPHGTLVRRQRILMRLFHPDRQLGAAGEEVTKTINDGVTLLFNENKKEVYDAELEAGGSHEDAVAAANMVAGGRRRKSRRTSRKRKFTRRR